MHFFISLKSTLLLVLATTWRVVLANTEIINFVAREAEEVVLGGAAGWPTLQCKQNEGLWSVQPAPLNTVLEAVCEPQSRHPATQFEAQRPLPCPHELWVVLDLNGDDWRSFSRFTLRLSWPASYPTDFLIQLYDAKELPLRFQLPSTSRPSHQPNSVPHPPSTLRRQYARIRLVDTGVLTPNSTSAPASSRVPEDVPFNLILEPLHYGVLPESVVPVVLFLVPVVVLASALVPFINAYLAQIAEAARREVSSMSDHRDKFE